MDNSAEKMVIEMLQEIKLEQQKLNKRLDAMDGNFKLITGEIGRLAMNMQATTEPTTQLFEINKQMQGDVLNSSIYEPISFENLHKLWNTVLSQVRREVSAPSFETWIKSTNLLSYDENNQTVTITAPNMFARDWLESHYSHLIKAILMQLTDKELLIEFVVQKGPDKEPN